MKATWINWHLDPEKLCWTQHANSNHPGHATAHIAKLPFHHDQYEEQNRLLNYILSQRYTIDMVLSIFGMGRRQGTS